MFIYILSLIIIGLLLFFGIRWIGDLIDTTKVIDATKFKVDLENAFNSIRAQYGSSKIYEFVLPDGIDQICFVDSRVIPANQGICKATDDYYDPIMCDAWRDNTSSVLFSPPIQADIDVGLVEISDIRKDLCFKTVNSHRIKLRLIGLGDMVRIEKQ